MTLQDFFEKNPKAAIAFSGGVASSYLLHEGMRFGKDVKVYYVNRAGREHADHRGGCIATGGCDPKPTEPLLLLQAGNLRDNSCSSGSGRLYGDSGRYERVG